MRSIGNCRRGSLPKMSNLHEWIELRKDERTHRLRSTRVRPKLFTFVSSLFFSMYIKCTTVIFNIPMDISETVVWNRIEIIFDFTIKITTGVVIEKSYLIFYMPPFTFKINVIFFISLILNS